jgi:hypothetical protein
MSTQNFKKKWRIDMGQKGFDKIVEFDCILETRYC